jgi:hypothetical protein
MKGERKGGGEENRGLRKQQVTTMNKYNEGLLQIDLENDIDEDGCVVMKRKSRKRTKQVR